MCTILPARDMAAESCSPTALEGRHDLQLLEAHITGIGFAPGRSLVAEDIRGLQRRTRRRGLGWRLAPPFNLGRLPSPLRWSGSALRPRLLPRFELLRQVSITPLYNGGVPGMLAFVIALAVILRLNPVRSFDIIPM
jgi:hypothetical protein